MGSTMPHPVKGAEEGAPGSSPYSCAEGDSESRWGRILLAKGTMTESGRNDRKGEERAGAGWLLLFQASSFLSLGTHQEEFWF